MHDKFVVVFDQPSNFSSEKAVVACDCHFDKPVYQCLIDQTVHVYIALSQAVVLFNVCGSLAAISGSFVCVRRALCLVAVSHTVSVEPRNNSEDLLLVLLNSHGQVFVRAHSSKSMWNIAKRPSQSL